MAVFTKRRRKRKAKTTGRIHSCAVSLGRRGGKKTARRRKRR